MKEAPPEFILCPECMTPSSLAAVQVTSDAPSKIDWEELLRKIQDQLQRPTRVPIENAEGDTHHVDIVHVPKPVKETVLILHEAKERALMEQAIASTSS